MRMPLRTERGGFCMASDVCVAVAVMGVAILLLLMIMGFIIYLMRHEGEE